MASLIKFIVPGETVVWHSERVWRPLSDSSLLLIPADIILLPLIAFTEAISSVIGRRVPPRREALLTDRRLLFREGLLRPTVTALNRGDIATLEVFAGDDTVLVHGKDSILHRATMPGEAVRLAQAAGVTTALWRSRLPPQARDLLAMRSFFTLVMGAVSVIIGFGAVLFHPTLINDALALLPASWEPSAQLALAGAAVGGLFLAGALAGYLSAWALAHHAVGGEDLRALRCWKFHAAWQGRAKGNPATPGRALNALLDRVFWGPPPDCSAIEAEIVQPNEWDRFVEEDWQHPIDPNAFRGW